MNGGVTGLDTWFWVNLPRVPLTLTTTLRSRSAVATIIPVRFTLDIGDEGTLASQSQYVVDCPQDPARWRECAGSASEPALRHVYRTKSSVGRPGACVYTISLTATWRGTYSANGGPPQDLGQFRTSASVAYNVVEVRGFLCADNGCPADRTPAPPVPAGCTVAGTEP